MKTSYVSLNAVGDYEEVKATIVCQKADFGEDYDPDTGPTTSWLLRGPDNAAQLNQIPHGVVETFWGHRAGCFFWPGDTICFAAVPSGTVNFALREHPNAR